MNKNKKTVAIIVGIIAVIAIAGVAVAIAVNNNANNGTVGQSTQSEQSTANVDPAKEFNPTALNSVSYVATTTTTVGGQTIDTTTESDGKGTTKTSSSYAGTTTDSYVTGTTVITCVNGECTKTTVEPTTEEANQATQDASQYKTSATRSGEEACGSSTCQVWKATGLAGEITYYIDANNRIVKISASGSVTTYDYKDVTITVPTVN